jgi:uncharacterized membrane protein
MAKSSEDEKSIGYIVNYLFLWLSGVIIYFTEAKKDSRIKFHAIQAILLGIFSAIVGIVFNLLSLSIVAVVASLIIWLYALYVGYEAYSGTDVVIPLISDYAEAHSNYALETKTKKKDKKTQSKENSSDDEALKHLKMRFAKGEITKKKYNEMKKEFE